MYQVLDMLVFASRVLKSWKFWGTVAAIIDLFFSVSFSLENAQHPQKNKAQRILVASSVWLNQELYKFCKNQCSYNVC